MIKKDIFDHDVKAQFQASAKERLYRFLMAEDQIKGGVVHATRMVKEMQANHGLGPLETLVLGQAYIAAALMSAPLKGRDRIAMGIQCSGPIKGLDVEANAFGEIRGYLKANPIDVKNPEKIKRLSTLYGAGFLSVTRYLEDAHRPYTGQIALVHGAIAEDLAEYFLASEQIPSGFSLSVAFDENANITGAGGIFLQALPGAQPGWNFTAGVPGNAWPATLGNCPKKTAPILWKTALFHWHFAAITVTQSTGSPKRR